MLHGELSENEGANLTQKMVFLYGVLVGHFFLGGGFKNLDLIDRLMMIDVHLSCQLCKKPSRNTDL